MDIARQLSNLVEAFIASEEHLDGCFLVEVVLKAGQKAEVYVDCDTGMTFDKCKSISRHLEAILDSNLWLGPSYTLEVSSPGIDRPLTLSRQYRKNIGRNVQITLNDQSIVSGIIREANEQQVTVTYTTQDKVAGKKIENTHEIVIDLNHINQARVLPVF
jgi:ribosome maturation factor RimP